MRKQAFVGLAVMLGFAASAAAQTPIKVLFVGDRGHHQPQLRYRQLAPVMARRGIELTYVEGTGGFTKANLAKFDGVAIYANLTELPPDAEKALVEYVEGGKGLIPLHCASYCFHNSPKYIAMVGAQFQRHGTGTFRTDVVNPEHPIMKGYSPFRSWDETYVHTKHNPEGRTVLETRAEGTDKEPWTWVRTQGKGRVFYTAWGHDQRTFSNPGFHNLVERGIRWATGRDPSVAGDFADAPAMSPKRTDVEPFKYVEANVPNYIESRQWGAQGEPITKMQTPLSPAESAKHYVHPANFEMRLFATEPMIGGKPIAMNWDERGRLWICETIDYPNEKQPAGGGRDRIRILEDTDGDGKADKTTIFADKLSIPTSLTFANGGVLVHQAPQTLFLKDTNGDDVCDQRTVAFSGWSVADTHAGPSNLRYGVDNWIYGMVGYAGFRGEIGGERQSFSTGLYRFRPGDYKFEFLRNTNNNSWGVGISEEGILFGSTANGTPSVHMSIPNRYYERVRGWSSSVLRSIAESNDFHPVAEHVRQVDYHGGFTAAAGHALYTARTYPPEYWNKTAFVTEPTGHLAATFQLIPNGATYRAHYGWNLVASDDEWASPIDAQVGPDGNVWVLDWYNFIVQHNPTPRGFRTGKGAAYETELRDKKHGRVYRVVKKGSPEVAIRSLAGATPTELAGRLADPNMFWRLHAQRLLVERGNKDVVPQLAALARLRPAIRRRRTGAGSGTPGSAGGDARHGRFAGDAAGGREPVKGGRRHARRPDPDRRADGGAGDERT
ncbi:MAG TPA: PVC-type heme-binding CxxCH protein [Planctomycetia bacterium]|nr:PVC-type heme-binding CxxCH protein [Planctomycetia bacterium]